MNKLEAGIIALIWLCMIPVASNAQTQNWVLIDTDTQTLQVKRGQEILRTFENISIGRYGATSDKYRRDYKTPIGEFRIVEITRDTAFHLFLRLDYPDLVRARRAYEGGKLNKADWLKIKRSHDDHRMPPQNTLLGGFIGIHGLGTGDMEIHERYNWTKGCVALTNEQIEALVSMIKIGAKVVIR